MPNHEPKVLSIVWNLIRGGTEGQCARTAMGLCKRGQVHRVAVFRREGFFLDAVEGVCGNLVETGITRMFTLETLRKVKQLSRLIQHEGFDLVHAWDADASIFGSLAARWAGKPFISSRRDMGSIYPPHKTFLLKRADLNANAVVVNAGAIAGFVAGEGVPASRIHQVPNMLDLQEFDTLSGQLFKGELPDEKFIVMVARLDPEKDTQLLLRSMQAVHTQHPGSRLVIAGDGVEREKLEGLSRELGLQNVVVFLGEVTDIPSLLKKASVGVLVPNKNEGLSNTILEYMAAGLPVVATDCGGNAELVQSGETGWIVPLGDDRQLAEKLSEVLSRPEESKEMGAKGRMRVETEFDPESVLDRFSSLYQQVVAAD